MKKFSKKGVLLFAGAMAICAFVLPSVASAASWGVIGTNHTLTSPDIGFTSVILGQGVTSSCTSSSFAASVPNATALEITTGSFGGLCTATGASVGTCTVTTRSTRFPWTVAAPTTSNVQINNIHIDLRFEHPRGLTSCANVNGADLTITGNLTGGQWTGNGSGQHSIVLANEEGLVSHSALGANNPLTARGTFTDSAHTLTLN